MDIIFKEVTNENVTEICRLSVKEGQSGFVAPNAVSLAEAYASLNENVFAKPFGIYDGNTLIGFIMIGYDNVFPDDPDIAKGNYLLWRLMLGGEFQGKGYAKPILEKAAAYIKSYPAGKADYVWLSYEKENLRAKSVYSKFGFRENGEYCGEEIVAVYKLD